MNHKENEMQPKPVRPKPTLQSVFKSCQAKPKPDQTDVKTTTTNTNIKVPEFKAPSNPPQSQPKHVINFTKPVPKLESVFKSFQSKEKLDQTDAAFVKANKTDAVFKTPLKPVQPLADITPEHQSIGSLTKKLLLDELSMMDMEKRLDLGSHFGSERKNPSIRKVQLGQSKTPGKGI